MTTKTIEIQMKEYDKVYTISFVMKETKNEVEIKMKGSGEAIQEIAPLLLEIAKIIEEPDSMEVKEIGKPNQPTH